MKGGEILRGKWRKVKELNEFGKKLREFEGYEGGFEGIMVRERVEMTSL